MILLLLNIPFGSSVVRRNSFSIFTHFAHSHPLPIQMNAKKTHTQTKGEQRHKIFYKNLRCFAKYAFDVVYVKTIVWYCLHLRCDEIRDIRSTWVIGLKREWDKWNSTKIIISSHDKKKRIINIILNDRFKINLWLMQTVSQWHELEQCDQYNKCFPLPRTSSSSRALFWAKLS